MYGKPGGLNEAWKTCGGGRGSCIVWYGGGWVGRSARFFL